MKFSKTKHYKYKLEEDYTLGCKICGEFDTRYMILKDGIFTVKKGYTWDGSSIPYKKLFRVLVFGFYDPDRYCKKASLVHDALCQAMREGLLLKLYKRIADEIYCKMCIEGGMPQWRARKRLQALRKFGGGGIIPEKNPRNTIYEVK